MKTIETRELERTFTLDRKSVSEETRTVSAALSSEAPVERIFGTEILVHTKEAINMERAKDGLPLLWAHDHKSPIGRVENIRLDADKVLRGDLRFSKNAKATEVWEDVKDGFLRDLSIGYRIDEYEEKDDGTVPVTRWSILESSVVTVPADSRVGINRNHEVVEMTEEVKTDGVAETETRQHEKPEVRSELKLFTLDKERERKAGAQLEAARRHDIRELFSKYHSRYGDTFSELQRACEDSPEINVERAKEAILDAIADGFVSVDMTARQSEGSAFENLPKFKHSITAPGQDQSDKFSRAMETSLNIQAGNQVTEEERRECQGTEWYGMSVADMARNYLRMNGERAVGERHQVIGKAMQRSPSHGSSHFNSVLENVANKAMIDGFMDADETWNRWANVRSIPDFKATSLLNMSLFTDLDQVREGAEYEYGDMSDLKETIQLATYGKLFGITRQALANDDLSALSGVPRAMGAAANRKVGDTVYAVLSTGTTVTMLQDSVALFASGHSNYVTAGAAPSVTTLNAARTAMALQTDPQGKTIGLRMRHLITPVALQTTAETLIAATYDPAGTAGTLTPNPFQGAVSVTADHRLDTFNSSGWFVASGTNQVVVGFLNGQQTPYMESKDGWSIDGIEYKVRIDCAATAEDYRGLYYNDGVN